MATPKQGGLQFDTSGIADLLRDLRRMDKELGKALTRALREVGDDVRDDVRSSTKAPYRTGRLRRSIKTSVRRGQVSLYSTLPQAPVHHWGGTIRPRGAPIRIKRTEFLTSEVAERADDTERKLGSLVDTTARIYAEFR